MNSIIKVTGQFYLIPKAITCRSSDECWYYSLDRWDIEGYEENRRGNFYFKNISNHSGRETLVKKLKAAKIPENSIIKVTGHTSTQGLRNCDPDEQEEFLQMLHAA